MSDILQVSVISPERKLFEGDAKSITLPGRAGSFTVLKNHAPLVAELEPGEVTVVFTDDKIDHFIVDGGFAEISSNRVSALVEGATPVKEIDSESEKKALEELINTVPETDELAEKRDRDLFLHRVRIRAAEKSA